ncbi:NAD-dependent epimerase/dehydratase family protein [Amnibacterium kyonggiense]|uniref:Nucleoside-diphosphate-sugar epimerase n=1 Tax=Amnibacterium kyonggiense TaxID=595671 RepID=A0A4R7FIX9_9MICO|nr:NAD-dependent epimerase/dehydratase family protein [Amnibacterium kyonggiense]TDS74962.1 nucleoside-diphosphate-sugar epimerase [Amnibacterium kyonggiense]
MTNDDALVGWTGFVGGNLARQREFGHRFSSRDSGTMRGRHFGDVVFSAARAEKWRANADPAADSAHVAELEDLVRSFTCERLTLISTVDVYDDPRDVDEESEIDERDLHAYGAHRLRLERTAATAHEHVTILRLPGLFGPGLKKNVVFDLLHRNRLGALQPASAFQYYNLDRIAADVARAERADLRILNLAVEPITTADVVQEVFGREPLPAQSSPVVRYDVRTRHASALGGSGPYLYDRATTIAEMRSFVRSVEVAA